MTSPEIKILVLIALVACVYAFVLEARRGRRTERLAKWVEAACPQEWDAFHWTARKFNRGGALAHLYRRNLIADPHFASEYEAVKPFQRRQVIGFLIGVGAIALVIIGSRYWGWEW